MKLLLKSSLVMSNNSCIVFYLMVSKFSNLLPFSIFLIFWKYKEKKIEGAISDEFGGIFDPKVLHKQGGMGEGIVMMGLPVILLMPFEGLVPNQTTYVL